MTLDREFAADLRAACPGLRVLEQEPLAQHTSFRIGGPAACMAFPKDLSALSALLTFCRAQNITTRLLGAGTNVLAPDDGLDALVICTKDALTGLALHGSTITAMAGQTLAQTAVFARDHGLAGLEFAHGIPGTVGGGVFMNAGAYGGELAQVCTRVTVMLPDGTLRDYTPPEAAFGYRTSVFQQMPCIIVRAEFALAPDDPAAIRARMQELLQKRRASQPLEYPSAGSAFKRPQGGYAAALIDQAGLRGHRVGNAAVAEKHAGFIINLGGATAQDVRALLSEVQSAVEKASGIRLAPELRIW